MESARYRYFSIRTDCYSNTWPTDDVEAYIENSGLFSRLSAGAYHGRNFFCALQIMRVKDWDGWSSNDYDSRRSNYIDIVTSHEASPERDAFLGSLSRYLGWRMVKETG